MADGRLQRGSQCPKSKQLLYLQTAKVQRVPVYTYKVKANQDYLSLTIPTKLVDYDDINNTQHQHPLT